MRVYDFDGTIRHGDSTADFYLFCLARCPQIAVELPHLVKAFTEYKTGKISKTLFKQEMYRFLRHVPDVDKMVEEFWSKAEKKMMRWYCPQKSDVVISASPEFLLRPMCDKLGVELMASRVDKKTGIYDGINCHGEEKVRRFREKYPNETIGEFYSDSNADIPLAKEAGRAYKVRGEKKALWMVDGTRV